MRTHVINVNPEDINDAKRKDSHRCMIATAIQRRIPWAKYIIVDVQSIRFSNTESGKRYIYMTPPEAQKELVKFDQGKAVLPFKFQVKEGHVKTMRTRQTLNRTTRKYKRTKRYMPARYREYGLRTLSPA